MSQIFDDGGRVIPVTLIDAGPCTVTQVKIKEKDGYGAVQVGFGARKHLSKSLQGHFKEHGKFRWVREFRIKEEPSTPDEMPFKVGDSIRVEVFEAGDKVKVSGISKGKGFQGVVKRHGFHGAPASHGTKHNLRAPGSIGASFPERVLKGKRMGGRMGGQRVSVRNLTVASVDAEHNLLVVKGAIPGGRGTLVEVRSLV